jgi:hypothetical protein
VSDVRLARLAYTAYGHSTGGLNYQGLPMPAFEDLGEPIQRAWMSAAGAVKSARYDAPGTFHCKHCRESFDSQLDRIEHLLYVSIMEEGTIVATVEDGLAEVETAEAAEDAAIVAEDASITKLDTDETADLAALTKAIEDGETLTDAQQARFDALTAKANADAATVAADQAEVAADDAALNAATPVVTPPPADGSGDGDNPPAGGTPVDGGDAPATV